MLHQHSQVSAPHPPHILQHFFPLLSMYGDLSLRDNFSALANDVCTLVELNPVHWNIHFDRNEVMKHCDENSLPQLLKSIYEMKAEQKHAKIWCCKSMASVVYVNEIEKAGIHPFYIHIYRDGRDVALSFLKAIVGEKHIYHLAKQWKEEQELAIEVCAKFPERSFSLRYEEFILDPASHVRALCEKMGIDFENEMLNYTDSEESKETASAGEMWGNLVKPVLKNNTRKYLSGLTEEQIRIFESVARKMLVQLGYDLSSTDSPMIFTEDAIHSFDELNKEGKDEARKNSSMADLAKRKEQDTFLNSLKKRWREFKTEKV